jgi:enamine deaminase RidA (YjgF/YER057c/UK114 family)
MGIRDREQGIIERFNVEGISVAAGFPYKHVASVDVGNAHLLTLSGMLGTDEHGKLVGMATYEQAMRALANVRKAIEAAASHLSAHINEGDALQHVVASRADLIDLSAVAELNRAYVDSAMPFTARTAVQVSKLPLGATVEISVTAALRK